jgi:hypothetical protein
LSRHTSIFAGYIISLLEYPECPESDIFEIADGGRNDGEQENKRLYIPIKGKKIKDKNLTL